MCNFVIAEGGDGKIMQADSASAFISRKGVIFAASTQVFWHQAMISLINCFERLSG